MGDSELAFQSEPTQDLTISRTSTPDQVANLLRARILRGGFSPGTPLREAALAASMGVSRNTLREGMRRLVAEGLLKHRVHRGVEVAAPTVDDVREIFEIRREIELSALRKSGEGLVRTLAGLEAELEETLASGDYMRVVELDLRFHKAIVDSLDNSRLSAFFVNTIAQVRLALFLLDSDDESFSWVEDHRRLCELLAEGRRRDAGRLLKAHLDKAEKRLIAGLPKGKRQTHRVRVDANS
jgi:DNA-binding GntR family transcriptional regulator